MRLPVESETNRLDNQSVVVLQCVHGDYRHERLLRERNRPVASASHHVERVDEQYSPALLAPVDGSHPSAFAQSRARVRYLDDRVMGP